MILKQREKYSNEHSIDYCTCCFRWKAVGNMAMFRNAVAGTKTENFKYNDGVLSMNRGNKGFFAMGVNSFSINVNTGEF